MKYWFLKFWIYVYIWKHRVLKNNAHIEKIRKHIIYKFKNSHLYCLFNHKKQCLVLIFFNSLANHWTLNCNDIKFSKMRPYIQQYDNSEKYVKSILLHEKNCLFQSRQFWLNQIRSDQSLSRVQLCDPMKRSTPGLPVHHQLPEFTQTHVHRVSDAIQPSHPLSAPSPLAPNPSQHQSLFQWVNSSPEVAKVLEFQL